ncbi:MAG: bifunctional 2-polyprenyl-6-hydroxyphenol methylase/3-demethylubiquinol 3-O-methyltransferase UbiG, partial [Sphingopyxis sp.]|nr:bifunctional 2-polyprenyl-6-hydroxyphenol methylase/3-demethylubiquinol 3-O-methyltransferase UbiG [Sphingopyxis sp.]
RINPVRLGYIRAAVDRHFGTDMTMRRPLSGRRALDVGCGAGLLCEPLARLGADTVGVDAAAENVAVASAHAAGTGLPLRYHHGDIADTSFADPLGRFDVVTSMEVIEHVADPALFLRALAARMADDGVMILSTPNRTAASRLLLVGAAEMVGAVPRGTHDWAKFLNPDELSALAHDAGLTVVDTTGLGVDLRTRGFKLGGSKALNYLMTLVKAPAD